MCYTGKCKYEGYMGDCTIHGKRPEDALCRQQDEMIERIENLESEKKDNNTK